MFYNFTLNTFASVVPSDYEIQNEFDESIVLPVVYDNTSTYAMGGTIALGSLGLTTASGGAILGAAASVVAPILAVVGLVGGALVVGQGLVNIYDYVSNMGLTKEQADNLDTSVILNKVNGAVHLQLVPKNSSGVPEPIEPTENKVIKDFGFSFISSTNKNKTPYTSGFVAIDSDSMVSSSLQNTSTFFKGKFKDKWLYYENGDNRYIYNFYAIARVNSWSNDVRMESIGKSEASSFTIYKSTGGSPFVQLLASETPSIEIPYRVVSLPYSSNNNIYDVLESLGHTILTSSQKDYIINSSQLSFQHPQYEFVIDKEIVENLNPDLEFNGLEYVDKNLGTVVNPSDLIVPMPDIMTDTSIGFSPEVEEVIIPNGPTTDPLPNPNPNPDADTGTGGDSDTETPPSEDQDKGFLQSVKEFFLNLWDWLCNFWQNLLDLLMYLFNLFFGGLLDLLGLIVDTVTNILNFLYELPSHLLNLFQELFVPSSDFFPSKFQNVLTGLTNKVPLFVQIKDFFTNLNLGGEGTPPKITITLPEFFGGETYDFIDFRFFEQYRSYYLNIVRVFMWIFALKHIYRRLPSVISGGGYL